MYGRWSYRMSSAVITRMFGLEIRPPPQERSILGETAATPAKAPPYLRKSRRPTSPT